ncbi:hypothetical protein Tco_1047230, partial [Tanacetum coccineum]
ATPTSSSSAGPSQKRSRSSTTSIPSAVHTVGALSPARADLLPPHKRYRGTSVTHSYESSDEGSPKIHAESDMDSDIQEELRQLLRLQLLRPLMDYADDEADAKIQPKDTIEIGVDVSTGIDIPDDLIMPDDIERLGQLEEGMHGMYDHILLERVVALEGSNTRLRDALSIERVRADSLQRRLGYVEEELRQVRELQAHESQRLWRMETFIMRTQDYRP